MSASTSHDASWFRRYFLYSLRAQLLGFITHFFDPNQFWISINVNLSFTQISCNATTKLASTKHFHQINYMKLIWICWRTPRRYPWLLSLLLENDQSFPSLNGSSTIKGIPTIVPLLTHTSVWGHIHTMHLELLPLLAITLLTHKLHSYEIKITILATTQV